MSKSIVVVLSSWRKGGNSETLALEFARGAREAGNSVECLSLREMNLQFCRGCLSCQKTHRCVMDDDANRVLETVRKADVLVFATPIYYYSVSGQLKTFLDRMNPLFSAGPCYKSVWLIASAADPAREAFDGAVKDIEGWISCFSGVNLAGVIRGGGLEAPGDVLARKELLQEAWNAGKKIS